VDNDAMMGRPYLIALAAMFFLVPSVLSAQEALTLATDSLPTATAGAHYEAPLAAHGGATPYTWQLGQDSKLPPGLHLHPHSGRIAGTPTVAGEYHFTLALTDVDAPPGHVQRDFTLVVVAGLTVEWRAAPHVSGTWIAGSLVVANHTGHAANLTVVVVAVNEIGRATALGYQHFTIQANAEQEIPFGSSPGPGTYVVRADAVAAFSAKHALRAHKETQKGELTIDTV
jgi:hypothetical protein